MVARSTIGVGKLFSIVLAVAIALGALSACSLSSNNNGDTNTNQPIKIGIGLSSSGDFASDGGLTKQGYDLWASDVNKNGGLLGRPVQLIYKFDKSDPAQTKANYEELTKKDHVDLLLGPFADDFTVAAGEAAPGYAIIDGTGNSPSTYDLSKGNLFCVSLPANDYLITFAQYILSLPITQRPTTVAYATSDDPFTQPQVQSAQNLLTLGGIAQIPYTPYSAQNATSKDYTRAALKIVQSGAQAVVLGTGGPTDYGTYIQIFKQHHYNPKIIIGTAGPDGGADFVKAVGGVASTEGQLVPNGGWWPTINTYQNDQFVNDFIAKFGGTPDVISSDAVQAYSVGQVLYQSVTRLGSLNQAKLIQELASGTTFNTVQGPVQFDNKGHNTVATGFLFQWQHGKLIPVYPDSQAQAILQYPKQQWP